MKPPTWMWILGGGTYDTPQHPVRKFYNDVWSSADGVRWKLHVESADGRVRRSEGRCHRFGFSRLAPTFSRRCH